MTTLKVILIAMLTILSKRMATGVVAEEGLNSGAVTGGRNYSSARLLFGLFFGAAGALTDTAAGALTDTAAVVADVDDEDTVLRNCSCNCGVPNQEIRIVGGRPTGVNRYPWVARLMYDGQFHCGGSLLNSDYVVTAAHCVRRLRRSKMRIILGDHDMHSTTETPIVSRTVSSVVRHRNFDLETYNHDIALLRLRKTVSFTKRVRPVCLPKGPSSEPAGKVGTVVGWGRVSEGGALPSVAQEVQVPILSLQQCRFESKYRPSRITSYMICAGKGAQDSCQGDSGGPLLVQTGGKFELVGIVSWGVGCGRPGYPGVYTRITRYLEWMQRNMKDTCLCTD